jgi:hypothetical protein
MNGRLRQLLDAINAILNRPSIPQLEEISRPTLKTLQQVKHAQDRTFSGNRLLCTGSNFHAQDRTFPGTDFWRGFVSLPFLAVFISLLKAISIIFWWGKNILLKN